MPSKWKRRHEEVYRLRYKPTPIHITIYSDKKFFCTRALMFYDATTGIGDTYLKNKIDTFTDRDQGEFFDKVTQDRQNKLICLCLIFCIDNDSSGC